MKRGVAEVSFIVVGVVMALAVDDFRSARMDRATERQLLSRLAEDLVADSADLAQAGGQAARRMVSGIRLLEMLGEQPTVLGGLRETTLEFLADTLKASLFSHPRPGIDEVAADVQDALYTNVFDPARVVFLEMASTGTLGLIRNVDLRGLIVSYYNHVEVVKEGDYIYRDAERDLRVALQGAGVGFGDLYSTRRLDRRLASSDGVRTQLRNVVGIAVFQAHRVDRLEERRSQVAAALGGELSRR